MIFGRLKLNAPEPNGGHLLSMIDACVNKLLFFLISVSPSLSRIRIPLHSNREEKYTKINFPHSRSHDFTSFPIYGLLNAG